MIRQARECASYSTARCGSKQVAPNRLEGGPVRRRVQLCDKACQTLLGAFLLGPLSPGFLIRAASGCFDTIDHLAQDLFLQACDLPPVSAMIVVAKSGPTERANKLWNRHVGLICNLLIHGDAPDPVTFRKGSPRHSSRTATADQADQCTNHTASASITTRRIISTGASTPVKCLNCRTA